MHLITRIFFCLALAFLAWGIGELYWLASLNQSEAFAKYVTVDYEAFQPRLTRSLILLAAGAALFGFTWKGRP